MPHFGPAILGSTVAIAALTPQTIYNTSDNFYHYASILDQLHTNLTHPLLSVLCIASDYFFNKIWIHATATRAPPVFL
jgi:hypothetical protein